MSNIQSVLSKVIVQLTRPVPGGQEVRFVTSHPQYTHTGVYDFTEQRICDIDLDTYYVSLPLIPFECSPQVIVRDTTGNLIAQYQAPLVEFCKSKRTSKFITTATLRELQKIRFAFNVYGIATPEEDLNLTLASTSEAEAVEYIKSHHLLTQIYHLKDAFDLINYDYAKIKALQASDNLIDSVRQDWEVFLDKVRIYKLYELAAQYREAKARVLTDEVKLRALNLQTEAAVAKLCKMTFDTDVFDSITDILTYWPFPGFVKTTGELVLSENQDKVKGLRILKDHYQTSSDLHSPELLEHIRNQRSKEIAARVEQITADVKAELKVAAPQEAESLREILDLFTNNIDEIERDLTRCTTVIEVLKFWPVFLAPAPDYVLQPS